MCLIEKIKEFQKLPAYTGGAHVYAGDVARVLNPADRGWYPPVENIGTAHTPLTSAVWGPSGDAPWSNQKRLRLVQAAQANLRRQGLHEVAQRVYLFATLPDGPEFSAIERSLAADGARFAAEGRIGRA